MTCETSINDPSCACPAPLALPGAGRCDPPAPPLAPASALAASALASPAAAFPFVALDRSHYPERLPVDRLVGPLLLAASRSSTTCECP